MKTALRLQFAINGLIVGTLCGMVAMCFVLVYKASRAVNFAQGEFLLVGARLCWGFMRGLNVPLWAGMATFAWFFKFSRLGLAMRATAFNQQVAQSLGVSIEHIFVVSWAISALVSGVAGVVVGVLNGISPGLSLFGIKVFPAVILGGPTPSWVRWWGASSSVSWRTWRSSST